MEKRLPDFELSREKPRKPGAGLWEKVLELADKEEQEWKTVVIDGWEIPENKINAYVLGKITRERREGALGGAFNYMEKNPGELAVRLFVENDILPTSFDNDSGMDGGENSSLRAFEALGVEFGDIDKLGAGRVGFGRLPEGWSRRQNEGGVALVDENGETRGQIWIDLNNYENEVKGYRLGLVEGERRED